MIRQTLQKLFKPKKDKPKKEKKNITYDCVKCGLLSKKKFEYYGNKDAKLMFVLDRPNKEELSRTPPTPFIGESSESLRHLFKLKGLDLKKDCFVTYAISCPYKKKKDIYAKCCRQNLVNKINEVKPHLIICFGEIAVNSVLNPKEKLGIKKLRNRIIPSHEFNCLVYSTFSPSEIVEWNDEYQKWKKAWDKKYSQEKDIEKVLRLWKLKYKKRSIVNKHLDDHNVLKGIELNYISTNKEFYKFLEAVYESGKFSFDYETTNTKPYDDNFEAVSISMAIGKKAWGIYLNDFEDIKFLKEEMYNLLSNEKILKYIQNDKFEELVSRWVFKTPGKQVIYNSFCTMISTHVYDERQGCTSQDFQNLVRFGLHPYNTITKKYLEIKKEDKKKGIKVNKIKECPKEELLKYNMLDTITCFANGELIKNKLLPSYEKYDYCYNFLFDGKTTFCDIEEKGIPIDLNKLEEIDKLLKSKQNEVFNKLKNLDEIKEYLKLNEISDEQLENFIGSPKKMENYLYKFLELKPVKKTSTGLGWSTDEEVIQYHASVDDEELCKQLVLFRKLRKARNTYIHGIRYNTNNDNCMHPSFNFHIVETYRLSSSDYNVQNLPKHDDIIPSIPWTLLREVFYIPKECRRDYIYSQMDYSGFELFIGAALSKDPKFIHDVNETDIHAREAVRIFELDCDPMDVKKLTVKYNKKEYSGGKHLRFESKNNGVFASVYGSVPFSIARNLRNTECFIDFAKDKYKRASTNLDFNKWFVDWSVEHITNWQENQFFKDYAGLKKWQDDQVDLFYKNGFVEYPFGFRRHHPLDRNKIINCSTQGQAALILVNSAVRINKVLKEEKFISKIVSSIHDDLTFFTYKPELYELIDLVNELALNPPFELTKNLKLKGEWSFGYTFASLKDIN